MVRAVVFSPDGKTLATGGFDGTIRLLDAASGAERACLATGLPHVNALAFSPDGTTLAAAVNGPRPDDPDGGWKHTALHQRYTCGRVELWDVSKRKRQRILEGPRGCVLGVAFSPDGTIVAGGGGAWADFGEVHLWDIATGAVTRHDQPAWAECVAFAPNGQTLLSGGGAPGPGTASVLNLWPVQLPRAAAGLPKVGRVTGVLAEPVER
jgi:WD40 repeat protein